MGQWYEVEADRPWNEYGDWATFCQQSVNHNKPLKMFQYEQQALGAFLLSRVSQRSAQSYYIIQLDTSYVDIDMNKDTYNLWAL